MIYRRSHPAFTSNFDRTVEQMLAANRNAAVQPKWVGKSWMTLDHCPKCQNRNDQHDMNCMESCPVARGEVTANG